MNPSQNKTNEKDYEDHRCLKQWVSEVVSYSSQYDAVRILFK